MGQDTIETVQPPLQDATLSTDPGTTTPAAPCACKKRQDEMDTHSKFQSLALGLIVIGLAVLIWKKVFNG